MIEGNTLSLNGVTKIEKSLHSIFDEVNKRYEDFLIGLNGEKDVDPGQLLPHPQALLSVRILIFSNIVC
jgi:hypothetical protein